ncbi:MAG: hypothetical protein HY040_05165 [Planctomycetes bacterium]|nr:hypothetical protein [Planctomycetota bacterium]
MARSIDYWYVRLTNGKVVRARSTKVLRAYIRSGRISPQVRVRRTKTEDCAALEWTPEFSDLLSRKKPGESGSGTHRPAPNRAAAPVPRPRVRSKTRRQQLRPIGVRGLVGELLNALDSSFNRLKLTTAAVTGFSLGLGLMVLIWLRAWFDEPWVLGASGVIGLLLMVAFSLATAVLTQATFIELSRLRPARQQEIRQGMAGRVLHVFVAQLLMAGVFVLALIYLRRVPGWILAPDEDGQILSDWIVAPVLALRMIGEAICWPMLSLTLLLGPILVIEDCSLAKGLADWWGLLRRHLGRLLTYEALALAVGVLVASPFVAPVLVTAWSTGGFTSSTLNLVREATLGMLGGIALAPFLAYMIVANAFIYLNLKYEFYHTQR